MKWNDGCGTGTLSVCAYSTVKQWRFGRPSLPLWHTKNEPCAPTRNDKMRLKNDRPKVHVDLSEVEQINGNEAWGL